LKKNHKIRFIFDNPLVISITILMIGFAVWIGSYKNVTNDLFGE